MRIRTRALIAVLVGVALTAVGCAQQAPELSATDTVTPSTTIVVADSSTGTPQPAETAETPEQVAARVVARGQDIVYATSDDIQNLIAIDTTDNGRNELNDLVAERVAPLRAGLTQLPPATTWYLVRPLTTTVEEQTDTTASVVVWSTTIFSRQALADPEVWFWLTDIDLVLSDTGQWLVDTYNQRPGPVAAPGEGHWPTTAVDLDTQLEGHTLLAAPGAPQ